MNGITKNDQKILNHLFSFLGEDQNNKNSGAGNPVIKQCLIEMLKAHPNINKIVENIKPYRDDAILVLIKALNLSGTEAFVIRANAIRVLENIGTHDAVSLLLENFDDYMNRFNFSFTKMLTIIAAREGERTKKLVIDRYIGFLIDEDNSSRTRRQNRDDKKIISVLDSLTEMNVFEDPRLPGILEKYVRQADEKSDTHQLALSALARADSMKATAYTTDKMKAISGTVVKISKKQIRTVYNPMEGKADSALIMLFVKRQEERSFINLFAKKQDTSKTDETPYIFEFEKPLIYFLADGTQDKKTKLLTGRAENQDEAINTAIQYLEAKLPGLNIPETKFQECHKLLVKLFDFDRWGFQQSFIQPEKYPTIIYNSEWCRVKFAFDSSGDQHDFSTHLHVYYGRLHAPGGDSFMIWNGEKCWCWHRVDYALNFLDGLLPEAAVKVEYSPHVIERYRKSDLAKKLSRISQAEWMTGVESEIWKHYGKRLFELFDLRHPELWERYANFIRKFHEIEKSESYGYPARDKIC